MSLGKEVAQQLPYLRRYARALSGTQRTGDTLVKTALESIVANPASYDRALGPRVALYRAFQRSWSGTQGAGVSGAQGQPLPHALDIGDRLRALNPIRRQALLLSEEALSA